MLQLRRGAPELLRWAAARRAEVGGGSGGGSPWGSRRRCSCAGAALHLCGPLPLLQGTLAPRVVTMASRSYAELCANRLERAARAPAFESVTCCSPRAGELKSGAAAVLGWAPGEVQGYRRGWPAPRAAGTPYIPRPPVLLTPAPARAGSACLPDPRARAAVPMTLAVDDRLGWWQRCEWAGALWVPEMRAQQAAEGRGGGEVLAVVRGAAEHCLAAAADDWRQVGRECLPGRRLLDVIVRPGHPALCGCTAFGWAAALAHLALMTLPPPPAPARPPLPGPPQLTSLLSCLGRAPASELKGRLGQLDHLLPDTSRYVQVGRGGRAAGWTIRPHRLPAMPAGCMHAASLLHTVSAARRPD